MFGYNFTTLIIILVIALLLFGPRRLPELGDAIGKAIRSFKKAHEEGPEAGSPKGEIPGTSASASTADPLTSSCPQCHKEFTGEFAFCPHCGHGLKKA
jgi:sec-independent protein translocase protein TatA